MDQERERERERRTHSARTNLKLLFEGASPVETQDIVHLNPVKTNLLATQDKLLVRSGDTLGGCDWRGKQDSGNTSQSVWSDTNPGQGCRGEGDSLIRDDGAAILAPVWIQTLVSN